MGDFSFLLCMSLCSRKNLCRAFITFIIRGKGSQKETGMKIIYQLAGLGHMIMYNNNSRQLLSRYRESAPRSVLGVS